MLGNHDEGNDFDDDDDKDVMADIQKSESKKSKQGFTLTVRVTVCLGEIKIAAAVTIMFLLFAQASN